MASGAVWGCAEPVSPPHRTWIHAMHSGPHMLGQGSSQTAQLDALMVYGIDLDHGWIEQLIQSSRLAEVNRYVSRVVTQITDILAHRPIDYIETTPRALPGPAAPAPGVAGQARRGVARGHPTPSLDV